MVLVVGIFTSVDFSRFNNPLYNCGIAVLCMAELNPFQIVHTNACEPRYKKDYPYSYLWLQSAIHPNCYHDISLDELKVYFRERFKLELDVSKFEDKWSARLVKLNDENGLTWIWGQSFDDSEEAWLFGARKTIQTIHEHNIPIIE